MVRYRWRYVGKTDKATIFVDYNQRKTKIVTFKNTYIHNGIYPFHDYDKRRRYHK